MQLHVQVIFFPVAAFSPTGETEQLAGVHVHQRRTIVYTLPGPSVGGSRNEARGVRGTGSSSVGEKKKNRKHVGKHTTTNVRCPLAKHCILFFWFDQVLPTQVC